MPKNNCDTYTLPLDSQLLFLPDNSQRKQEGGLRKKGHFKSDRADLPLVSIVTVVFNGEKHLESTIKSVIDQSYNNIEYIIIDGGSSDRTLDIIKSYENYIDYWVSEPDTGIYDAMNKGIQVSQGELIGIINSDDWYAQKAIENVISVYRTTVGNHKNLLISGGICKFNEDSQTKWHIYRDRKYVDSKIYWTMPVSHPATFISKKLYNTVGLFDSKFKISGDYDLIFRAYHSAETKFIFIDKSLAYMRDGGVSNQFKHILTRGREHFEIKRQNMPLIFNLVITFFWLSIEIAKFIVFNLISKYSIANKLFLLYNQLRHGKNR
jgi:glycosyltransferase involved in cell wall biosynthesis